MKKNNKVICNVCGKDGKPSVTVGLDLGDRSSRYCIVDETGEVVVEGSTASTKKDWIKSSGLWRVAAWLWLS